MDRVCQEITDRKGPHIYNIRFMKEVIDKYHSRTGKVAVIIIKADQRRLFQKPAQLSAAAFFLF